MHLLVHCVSCSFLAKHQITQLTQPPYSPDLVPWDFWLFSKLKSPLKRKIFQTINEIQENTTGQLMVIPTKDCAECFEQSKRCLGSCVRSQGAYCEGDWGVIVQYTIFLVSCIFNKCFYFSYYMAGYFLGTLCILCIYFSYFCSDYPVLDMACDQNAVFLRFNILLICSIF